LKLNRKPIFLSISISVLFSVILLSSNLFNPDIALADESSVPDWFRGVAGFWAEGLISTAEFVDGIEFLIGQGIIEVPSSMPDADAQTIDQATIDDVWVAIGDLQTHVDEIELLPGPMGPNGPEGPQGEQGSQGTDLIRTAKLAGFEETCSKGGYGWCPDGTKKGFKIKDSNVQNSDILIVVVNEIARDYNTGEYLPFARLCTSQHSYNGEFFVDCATAPRSVAVLEYVSIGTG